MTNVYRVLDETLPGPVTFFANDSAEAFLFFLLWRERIEDGVKYSRQRIMKLTELDLADEPQLALAARSGIKGVGWWLGHLAGWAITAPDADAIGQVSPPEPDVTCYLFLTEEHGEAYVFAQDHEEAMTTFEEFCLQANGKISDFLFRPISRWLLTGPKATLREDMDEGLIGVGKECENGFWHIVPAGDGSPL